MLGIGGSMRRFDRIAAADARVVLQGDPEQHGS